MEDNEGARALAYASAGLATKKHLAHAVVAMPGHALSDGPLLRIVEHGTRNARSG